MEKRTPTQPQSKDQSQNQTQNQFQVSIIGFGRFGQLWASLIKSDFPVKVYDRSEAALEQARKAGVPAVTIEDALAADVIFYSVPISEFAATMHEHARILKTMGKSKLIIDLLSVKVHAKEILTQELTEDFESMLCHPLFGPDSVNQFGLSGQRIVIEQFRASDETYKFWKNYFAEKQLKVIEMTAEEHDEEMAGSQALTHLVGRILSKMHLSDSQVATTSSQKLKEVTEQVSKDEFQLFLDMQRYNPYTRAMRERFVNAQSEIYKQIDDS
jgi:prephenate dehydrogenase